jgi:hypothetical protein
MRANDTDSSNPRRCHWVFGICLRSNRRAKGGKPVKPAKPSAPMGCKLVGTVKGTKLWAGDCAAPPELRGSALLAETDAPTPPDVAPNAPAAKQ